MHRHRNPCHALAGLLLLAGCAHLPEAAGPRDRDPARTALADRPAAEQLPGEARADTGEGTLELPDAAPHDRQNRAFADLFARMRSGFALPPVDELAVQREIAWYQRHPAYLARTFGRGKRYLHHIVEELEGRGMPRELALLPVVESAFDPFALSHRLASGLWQFVPRTGRRYGLEQDWWSDDRRDVLAATRAALDHLGELHEEFRGDWLLALAAYNAGSPKVRRAVARNERGGRPTDFFALPLPRETRAYVPKLLALSRLVAEPGAYGVALPPIPDEPYFAQVDIGSQIDLELVADRAGIPREELRALNPAFNRFATAPDGPHRLLVPAPARESVERAVASLPPGVRLRLAHHKVRRGDTLGAIARRHGISVAVLRAVNRLRGSLIRPGQDLLVPLS